MSLSDLFLTEWDALPQAREQAKGDTKATQENLYRTVRALRDYEAENPVKSFAAGFTPAGYVQDAATLLDPEAPGWEKGLAGISFIPGVGNVAQAAGKKLADLVRGAPSSPAGVNQIITHHTGAIPPGEDFDVNAIGTTRGGGEGNVSEGAGMYTSPEEMYSRSYAEGKSTDEARRSAAVLSFEIPNEHLPDYVRWRPPQGDVLEDQSPQVQKGIIEFLRRNNVDVTDPSINPMFEYRQLTSRPLGKTGDLGRTPMDLAKELRSLGIRGNIDPNNRYIVTHDPTELTEVNRTYKNPAKGYWGDPSLDQSKDAKRMFEMIREGEPIDVDELNALKAQDRTVDMLRQRPDYTPPEWPVPESPNDVYMDALNAEQEAAEALLEEAGNKVVYADWGHPMKGAWKPGDPLPWDQINKEFGTDFKLKADGSIDFVNMTVEEFSDYNSKSDDIIKKWVESQFQ